VTAQNETRRGDPAAQGCRGRLPRRLLLGAAATALVARPAMAAWPERPMTLLHGFAPGGSADALARVLAVPLGSLLGQPVLVEPRPGAGGMVASAALNRATPDGHTIGLMTGGHAVGAAFARSLPFDPVNGYTWVSKVVEYGFVIVVRADHPAQDLRGVLDLAASTAALTYGSAGVGSTHHLAGELLGVMSGARLTHVPYRGEADAITALMAGDLTMAVITTVTAGPHLRGGRLRGLAVTAPEPAPGFPAVPPVARTVPGYAVTTWAGLAAPPGIPAPAAQGLHQAVITLTQQPTLRSRLSELVDGNVRTGSPTELRDQVAGEIARWRELIAARGLQID
jgi:tripartite-type tricarboxylate transporter receptor subunit TctC